MCWSVLKYFWFGQVWRYCWVRTQTPTFPVIKRGSLDVQASRFRDGPTICQHSVNTKPPLVRRAKYSGTHFSWPQHPAFSRTHLCVFKRASLKSPKVSASPDMLRILLFPLRAARECKCFTDLLPNNVSLLQLGTFQTYFWSSCLLVGIRVTTEHNSYITAMKSDGAKWAARRL